MIRSIAFAPRTAFSSRISPPSFSSFSTERPEHSVDRLMNLGWGHQHYCDPAKALPCFTKALRISRNQTGVSRQTVARCLENIGECHRALGSEEIANSFSELASQAKNRPVVFPPKAASARGKPGARLFSTTGRANEASCSRKTDKFVRERIAEGKLHIAQGDPILAIPFFAEALSECRESSMDPTRKAEQECLKNMGECFQELNMGELAKSFFERADQAASPKKEDTD